MQMSRWMLVLLTVLGLCTIQSTSIPVLAQSGASFTEVTNQAGLEIWLANDIGGWHGTYVVDFDNDGWEDMFVTSHGIEKDDDTGYNALFRNNGNGTFTNVAFSAGVDDGLHGRFTRELHGAPWFDYDLDGDFDLYLPNTDSLPNDSYNGFDRIFRNDGDGTFTDVSSALGLEQNNYSRRGGVVADIDLDGDLDILYVNAAVVDANDNRTPDSPYRTVYINRLDQDGRFTLENRGIDYVEWSEGISSLDYDNDGDVDILVANQDGNVGRLVLWENDGTGNFSDVTASVGLDLDDGLEGSVTAADVDNDGDLDVYTTDGLYRNDVDEFGTFAFLGAIGGVHEDMHFADLDNDGDVDLVSAGVYWNDGSGSFTRNDLGVVSSSARGGMAIDYDYDGDLDLIFNEDDRTKPYLNFFRNNLSNGNRWLRVALVDPNGAIGSPGAKVSVYEAGTSNLLGYREVATATGFVSGASPTQHFGLGSHSTVDVVVTFTNGSTVTQQGVGADQEIIVDGQDPDGEAPATPGGLGAVTVSDSRIDLDWANNSEPDLDGYHVYRSTTTGFVPDASKRVASNVAASQYSDAGLSPSTPFYYRVTAVDLSGNESEASSEASATTASVPATQTLQPVADTFVKKDDASSHGSEDRLLAKHSNGSSRRETFLKFNISSITEPVTDATLRIRSFTSSSWPESTTVVVREFTSSAWNESINWNTRPSDSALGATLASLPVPQFTEFWWEVDVTDYVEAQWQAGASEITFAVRGTASKNGGLEMWSRESATPPELVVEASQDSTAPAAPSSPSASAQSTSQVTVDWADNGESDLAGYHLYRSTQSGFTPGTSNRIASGLGSSQFVDTGLAASTTYFYRVTAVDVAANESSASVEVSATTDDPDTTPPAAPAGLLATPASTTQIDLNWDDNAEGDLAGYNVYRGSQSGFTVSAGSLVAAGVVVSQYSDTGLTADTTYYYKVTAFDVLDNESPPSPEASATTHVPDTTPPGVPSAVSATEVSSAQIDLDWADNGESDLAGYAVYRSTQAGFTPGATNRVANGLTASQFSDTGLASGTTYYYRVTASDDSGNESAPSAEASATTDTAPATQTLNPVADTYVKQSDTSSHGSEDRLLVKLTGGSSTRHTYLKFDTSSIEGSVSQVILRLNVFTQVSSWPNSVTVQLRELANSSWAESINWNNRPPDSALGNVLGTIQAPVDPPQWWEIDVTAYVAAARAAGSDVISFAVRSANSTNGGIEIWSRESSTPPELVVDVN